jgi:predicted dehydrogenase
MIRHASPLRGLSFPSTRDGRFQKDETQLSRNIALIGCGAISQLLYIPALANARRDFGRVWIVDPRARVLGAAALAALGTAEIVNSLEQVKDDIALAIIAAPNGLHFHLAREALKRGAHVLIEKPFVVRPSDAADLLEIAATQDRLVVVNQTRRFFPLANEIRHRIKKGDFGAFKSASHFEGAKLAWPFESGAAFAKDAYRTGVIMDIGVHVLDFYHFLLAPKWDLVSAIHDGFNGPEGLAEICVMANSAPVNIRLSRYCLQQNLARLSFEEAELWADVHSLDVYWVKMRGKSPQVLEARPFGLDYNKLGGNILRNFVDAVDQKEPPMCDGASSLPVIALLDKIYRSASLYPAEIGIV